MNMWRSLREAFESSLRVRALVGVLLSVGITIGFSIIVHLHSAYEEAELDLSQRTNRMAVIMADTLARPLFDFNHTAVASAVEALSGTSDIAAIRVLDASGAVVAMAGDWSMERGTAGKTWHVARSVSYREKETATPVGHIELLVSTQGIRQVVLSGLLRAIEANAFFALAIVALLFFFSGRTGKQFAGVVAALEKLKGGDVSIQIAGANRKDEIGRLAQAVESFRDTIVAREQADAERERLMRELQSERERTTQEALDRSEAQYRLVVENVAEGILIVQEDRVVLANPRVEQLIGRTAEQLRAGPFVEFVHPDDRTLVLERHAQCLRGEPIGSHYVFRIVDPAGAVTWIELSAVMIDWQGKPATLSFLTNITERKRLEEALLRTLVEREVILENSVVGIALLTPQGRLQWANSALTLMFGASRDASLGVSLEPCYVSREEYLRVGGEVARAVARGDTFTTEMRMRRLDGSLFWVNITGKAVNPHDLAQGTVWVVIDINRRRELEEQLKRTTDEQEVILQSTQIGISHTIGRVHQYVNRTFAAMLGYEVNELINHSSRMHFPDEASWRKLGDDAYPIIARGEAFTGERQFMRKNGEVFWVQMIGKVIDASDPGRGAIWTVVDITQHKQAEQEIRGALEKQRELNDLKSSFVSMTSHEFRTPLATILSSTELLKYYSDRLAPAEKESLVISIEDAVRHMTHMLDNVLTLGRVDAGRLEFKPGPLDVVPFCRALAEEAARATAPHGQDLGRLRFVAQCDGAPRLLDDKLLRHVLGNLLSNAFKYSPQGGAVEFAVVADGGTLVFSVRDHGIGIPAEDRPKLFEAFHRAGNVGNIAGTGLGLSIVRHALDLHGGTIALENLDGPGTCFRVEVPAPCC